MSAHVYFVAASNGQGDALWETDGTIAGTVQVGGSLNVGVADANTNGLDPNYWTVLGDDLLFGGVDNYGTGIDALWVSDGSASGTYEIGGVANQAVADSFLAFYVPRFFTGFGDKALFVGANAADHYDLWVTDGTTTGTVEIGGADNAGVADKYATGWAPGDYVAAGSHVFFDATDSYDYTGLWVTDGTAGGTQEIGGLDEAGVAGVNSAGFSALNGVAFGQDLLFTAPDSTGHLGDWVSDGTALGTFELVKFPQVIGGVQPVFATAGPLAYFAATDSAGGLGLWVTNGTVAGTYEVGGTNDAGVSGITDSLLPVNIATFGARAIFAGLNVGGSISYSGLWVSDGTTAGTYEVGGALDAGVNGAPATFGLNPKAFGSLGSVVVFSGYDRSGNQTLWSTDGTAAGTFEIGGLNNAGVAGAYAGGLNPTSFIVSGDEAYFVAKDSTDNSALFVTNGTLAGTYLLAHSVSTIPTPSVIATGLGSNVYSGPGIATILSGDANNSAYLENSGTTLDYVQGTGGAISLDSAQSIVDGEGNAINFQGGVDDAVRLRNTSAADTIYGQGGKVYDVGGGPVTVEDGDDLIVNVSAASAVFNIENNDNVYDIVRRNAATVNLTSGQTIVAGGGFTVNFDGGTGDAARLRFTSGVADTVNGSGGTVYDVGSQVNLTGSDDLAVLIGSSTLTATADHEIFAVRALTGNVTINGFTPNDRLRLASTDFSSWSALSPHVAVVGDATVITYAPNETLTLTNYTSLTQPQVHYL